MSIKNIVEVAAVFLPILFEGFKMTILIAVAGLLAGFVIGVIFGCMRHSDHKILKGISGVYINIFRPLPLLVQALYFYYVVPKMLHIDLSGLTAAIIVMSLNSGAFFTEIVRGALDSVEKGVKEAGIALGLSGMQVFFHITMPTAFRAIVPSLCNQFII